MPSPQNQHLLFHIFSHGLFRGHADKGTSLLGFTISMIRFILLLSSFISFTRSIPINRACCQKTTWARRKDLIFKISLLFASIFSRFSPASTVSSSGKSLNANSGDVFTVDPSLQVYWQVTEMLHMNFIRQSTQ